MASLHIDTRDSNNVTAELSINGTSYKEVGGIQNRRPESILILIDKVCRKAGVTVNQIDEINVEQGPGSFTGIKVGVSVANALSFALGKKVNSLSLGELVEPKYE